MHGNYCFIRVISSLYRLQTNGHSATPVLFGDIGSGPFAAFRDPTNIVEHLIVYRGDTCLITEVGEAYCSGDHSANNPQTVILNFLSN